MLIISFHSEFQQVVVETLMAILDELKSQNKGGDSEDEGLTHLPLGTVEEVERMSIQLEKRPKLKRSLVSQIKMLQIILIHSFGTLDNLIIPYR